MCKQDIQIGRRLFANRVTKTIGPGVGAMAFPSRLDRVSIALSVNTSTFGGTGDFAAVGVSEGGVFTPFATVGFGQPSRILRVADFGQDLFGEIWVKDATTGGTNIWVVEYYLNVPLEDLP